MSWWMKLMSRIAWMRLKIERIDTMTNEEIIRSIRRKILLDEIMRTAPQSLEEDRAYREKMKSAEKMIKILRSLDRGISRSIEREKPITPERYM